MQFEVINVCVMNMKNANERRHEEDMGPTGESGDRKAEEEQKSEEASTLEPKEKNTSCALHHVFPFIAVSAAY